MTPSARLVIAALALCATSVFAELPTGAREQLNAVLWLQTATEYRGTALQAYRDATRRLAGLKASSGTASVEQAAAGDFARKAPAVVLDIDETVLDNSPYTAGLVQSGRAFDQSAWEAWVQARQAKSVPGAAEFIRRARHLGYRVIYITNRNCNSQSNYDKRDQSQDCPQKAATLDNLQSALGYRPAESDLLMRFEVKGRDDSDKRARREATARHYRIVMLVGDDLSDFIRRADYSEPQHAGKWGERWFVIPNPIYGSWARAFPDLADKYAGLTAWTAPGPSASGPGTVSVVSWNLEWLADPETLRSAGFWSSCEARGWPNAKLRPDLPFCDVYQRKGILSATDYEARKLSALRQALADRAARRVDILAVQEVQGPAALEAVLPDGYQVACFTTRQDAQNLGYVIRIAAGISHACREIAAISLEHDPSVGRPVRRALELSFELAGKTITLLNVHLKSGCPTGRMDRVGNDACRTLQRQADPLEQWVEETAKAGRPFLIIGDWNRDLEDEARGGFPARSGRADPTGPTDSASVRNLFPEINDGAPAASAMELAKVDRVAAANRACHAVLDQLVISVLLKAQLDPASLAAGKLPAKLVNGPPEASDHCALETVLNLK